MSNYIGVRCPVCNKKFAESDDIVVCPVCGAPHHRDCYASKNQCAFHADHLSGKVWQDETQEEPGREESDASNVKTCKRCGASNTGDSIFCQVCGAHFAPGSDREARPQSQQPYSDPGCGAQMNAISMAYGGLDPEEEIGGEKVRDLACYVGSGSAYYLPRFYIMDRHNRMATFNLPALIFGFFYYFYRKMYLVGVFLALLCLISNVPSVLYTWEIFPQVLHEVGLGPAVELNMASVDRLDTLNRITRSIDFIVTMVASVFANRYYSSRAVNAVREIREEAEKRKATPQQYSLRLAQTGGNSKAAVVVVLIVFAVIIFSVSGVLASQYMPVV